MKRKLSLIGIVSLMVFCLVQDFAHAQNERPMVRLAYFYPKDVDPHDDIDSGMDALIKKVQQYFAEQMDRHGYGRKTFTFESDADGKAIVYQIPGKHDTVYYQDNPFNYVRKEVTETLQLTSDVKQHHIVLTVAANNVGDSRTVLCTYFSGMASLGSGSGGFALVCGVDKWSIVNHYIITAHELGHVFGLNHDFRDADYIMSYGPGRGALSPCDAEWLNVHRAFNSDNTFSNESAEIKILSTTLESAPNVISSKFEVSDPDGLYQARLFAPDRLYQARLFPNFTNVSVKACKRINGTKSTIELKSSYITTKTEFVGLRVIDVNGNVSAKSFPIDISQILPPPRVVSIPDMNLAAAVRRDLGLNLSHTLTTHTMLELTSLSAQNSRVKNLSGIENAINLQRLHLDGVYVQGRGIVNTNQITDYTPIESLPKLEVLDISYNNISDISFLAELIHMGDLNLYNNNISDISSLAGLTELSLLDFSFNNISDISHLAGLIRLIELRSTNNNISDISSLSKLTQLYLLDLCHNSISDISPLIEMDLLTTLYLHSNPLSYASINTHIPVMQKKGIKVKFDKRTPTRLLKISGDTQQVLTNTALPLPFVVEVQDERNQPFAGVPVTFAITEGNGKLSETSTTADAKGRAQGYLTFGEEQGDATVKVTAVHIEEPVTFTATAISIDLTVNIPNKNLHTNITETLGKPINESVTVGDMLTLTRLKANDANINDLTGLEYASNLTTLYLNNNSITDVERLAELTKLRTVSLNNNQLSDVTALGQLTVLDTLSLQNNDVSDVSTLTQLLKLKTLNLSGNLLNYASLNTHIPLLQTHGTSVSFENRIPTEIQNESASRHAIGGNAVVYVSVLDENGIAFAGVPVTLTLTPIGGSPYKVESVTNHSGNAHSGFKIGSTPGENKVRAQVKEIPHALDFTITGFDTKQVVQIPDKNLLAKIKGTLNLPANAEVTAGDMINLTYLYMPNSNVQDLTGLEYAYNLTALILGAEYINGQGWVNNNRVTDFSPLQSLTQLVYLNVAYSSQLNLSEIAKLTHLTYLDLTSNSISNSSPLNALTQLKTLNLSHNSISDISAFIKLINLEVLSLINNNISDISPLAGMTQLTQLNLGGNSISDITSLAELTQLTNLSLDSNNISDISPLKELTQLTSLGLRRNKISDISPLAGMTQLTQLALASNSISDVSPLAGLTQLVWLELSNNIILDISAFIKLINIEVLLLINNNISDVSPLQGMTQLIQLRLSSNNISDVSPLQGMTQLDTLLLDNNNISDVSPLVKLNLTGTQWNSTGLDIRNNPLNNDSIRTHIPAMQERGIVVSFDNITHPEFHLISGDKQEELVGRTLPSPFVVEYRDANGKPKEGVKVTFSITDGDAELTDTTIMTDADGRAQTFLRFGWKLGIITVNVTAEGINSQLTFTARAVLPENHVTEDVNVDGVVDVMDLVLVAATIGTTPPEGTYPNPDVNGDGVINSDDLALVMAALENAPTAPAAVMTAENLKRWIDEAKQLTNKDTTFLRGIGVLEQLLETLLPKKTALLANYPNPFNPETWIPYHLAKPAEVTLHIYAIDGALVQTLALGHRQAGIYEHQSRAAYWDGRNAQGERVASGIYLYTLTAGEYTSTRKMLIRK